MGDATLTIHGATRSMRRATPAMRCATLVLAIGVVACSSAGEPEAAVPARATPVALAAPQADSALRAELIAMGERDQAVREGMSPATIQDTAFVFAMLRADSALSLRLREIIETHGWPDAARLGNEAVDAAFLIVQHTPFDDFREAMLPYVERDARAGVLDPQNYANMIDRVRLHRGERQLYGSSYSLVDGVLVRDPVEDPADLDRRRSELGLIPIAEYERMLAEAYQAEVRAE